MKKILKNIMETKLLHHRMYQNNKLVSLEKISEILFTDQQITDHAKFCIDCLETQIIQIDYDRERLAEKVFEYSMILEQETENLRENCLKFTKRRAVLKLSDDGALNDTSGTRDKTEDEKKFIMETIKKSYISEKMAPQVIESLVLAMRKVHYPKDSVIIKEGDVGKEFFILQSGKCKISKSGVDLSGKCIEEGCLFGDLALVYDTPRAATISAERDCVLWIMGIFEYKEIIRKFDEYELQEKMKFIRHLHFFGHLTEQEFYKLAQSLRRNTYKCGDKIVKEGEMGDVFYIVKEGDVKVLKSNGDFDEFVAELHVGDYFGERSLITGEVRNATVVVSSSQCVCYEVSTRTFDFLIGHLHKVSEVGRRKKGPREISPEKGLTKTSYSLNDIKYIERLGNGKFGKVDLVTFGDENVYALKSLARVAINSSARKASAFRERDILFSLNHPFTCTLYQTFRDSRYLYFLMEAYLGGGLDDVVNQNNKLSTSSVSFYVGCMVLALEYLKSKNIIHRDIKLENIRIDGKGYPVLVDFGLAKNLGPFEKTYTTCGSPLYLPPELIDMQGYDHTRELWSIGIMTFILSTGREPYVINNVEESILAIRRGIDAFSFPFFMNKVVEDFVRQICRNNPCERLGNGNDQFDGIKKHKMFSGINWTKLLNKEYSVTFYINQEKAEDDSDGDDDFKGEPQEDFSDWDVGF